MRTFEKFPIDKLCYFAQIIKEHSDEFSKESQKFPLEVWVTCPEDNSETRFFFDSEQTPEKVFINIQKEIKIQQNLEKSFFGELF